MISNTLALALSLLFRFLEIAIIADVILSWVMPGRGNALTDLIHVFTEPLMRPGRILQQKLMPGLPLDFSPIIAFVMIDIVRGIVFSIL
ncbi:YggT family protein [Clostridium luticellarii]|uniref:YGGT family protein n=1 Tax=Clostridium luticellarii TaxID=1691940 RepID=A0A2T0BRS7_9CLOT|nr:YggT family protein [Clostridium luticellarii]MCI1943718.1 YggT family protein [Clostridium luticellarii]MCI1966979.1 YggT family protein [Clostridium luticellarii]MCI1994346.1 YggT family protein [Clostridium luticellarii]MCI2038701.1 YggT family protein [Clostridium luticellarii]PRR86576.1 YGGT family protein [Clostridium luticellarii]